MIVIICKINLTGETKSATIYIYHSLKSLILLSSQMLKNNGRAKTNIGAIFLLTLTSKKI